MSKFKLILIFMGLLPVVSWAQGPCEFDVPLPNYYICYSENGIYLPLLNQPTGTYSGEFVTSDGFLNVAEIGPGPQYVIYTADPSVCIGSDTVDFYVLQLGYLSYTGLTSICSGDSTTLVAENDQEFDWGTGVRTNAFTFSPDSTTTYTVLGNDINGCTIAEEITITVFQYGPGLTITGPANVCYGDTVTYQMLGTTSVLWNDGSTNPIIEMQPLQDTLISVYVGENPACDTTLELFVDVAEQILYEYEAVQEVCYGNLFQFYITGGNASYYKLAGQNFTDFTEFFLEDDSLAVLEAYNDIGCFVTRDIQLVVHDYPVLQIDAPEQLCGEDSLGVMVSGAPAIEWLDLNTGQPVELTGINEYNVIASDSIHFQLTGTSDFGCVTTEILEIPIYPAPDVRIDSLTPFCIERMATVTATGADFYLWNGLDITNQISFPVEADTVFTVFGSTIYGCYGLDTISITAHPNPEIWLTGEYYICELDTATLVGSGAYQYFWDGVQGSDTLDAMPSADSLFTLIGKNIFGCADTATYFVDVDPAPVITFIGDSDICVGDSVSLQMITDGLVFQWLGGSIQSVIPVEPADDTTYTVTAIGANSCPRTSSFEVTVHDYPVLTVAGNTTVCFGDFVTLYAEGADVFLWNNGLQGDTMVYVPVASGILRVDGNSNDCVTQELISITVHEYPSVQFSFNTDTLCTSGGGASWIASPAGGELSGDGVEGNWFNLSSATTGVNIVTYTVTNEFNCTASASDQLIVESCIGLEENAQQNIAVYPNPCTDKLVLQATGNTTCAVFNSLGQNMWSGQVSGVSTIETGTWAPGTYVLMLDGGMAQRIVKL